MMNQIFLVTRYHVILTFGLNYAIPPNKLNKTDILSTFDLIYCSMKIDLKNESNECTVILPSN